MENALSKQISLVERSIAQLDNWITQNGWAGYDPYDFKQHPLFTTSKSTFTKKTLGRAILLTESFFPMLTRRVLHIPREVNAKAMGLFTAAYQILYKITNKDNYLYKSQETLKWLEENPSRGYMGLCWGHPFGWQSRIFIPRDTPSSVITAIVGDALWRFYRMTGQSIYLSYCQSICEFFLNNLNIDSLGEDKICFSKTPLDNFHIHNSNLFVADFLIKIGNQLQKKSYIETAYKAITYTLSEQNENGSFCYWGRDQGGKCLIDHYHSGFAIRCLYSIWKSTNDKKVYNSLKRYYKFYCGRMFTNEGIPKMTPKALFPINIHSCAEAILCHSTL
ncbi:MAG: hypothetical protein E3J23_01405, partial [Candidatus Stahlbacteria bacterium]